MTALEFDKYCEVLRSFGLKVYQNARATFKREAVFTDGTHIGRMEAGNDCVRKGVMLHTVCYPHKLAKTGYAIQSYCNALSLEELTQERVREAFALTPPWMKHVPEGLHAYDSFEHWRSHSFLAKKYIYDGASASGRDGAAA